VRQITKSLAIQPTRFATALAWAARLALVASSLGGVTAVGQEAAAPAVAEELAFLRVARDAADRPG
jgi:hypothetical protein